METATCNHKTGEQKHQPQPRLVFANVSSESGPDYDVPLWGVSCSLQPGELLLVRLERGHLRTPLADLALGLIEPRQGQVCFQGEDWCQVPAERAAIMRGRCRRVFDGQGWCSSLSLDANICLAQQHHGDSPQDVIEAEAAALSLFFGLPGLPLGLPTQTRAGDLGRAALVRAFLGRPQLIILEQPTRNLYPEILPPLLNALRSARRKGAAVIWTTSDVKIWEETAVNASLRGTMFGSRMQLAAKET